MKTLLESLQDSLYEGYGVFKGEETLNSICPDKKQFQELVSTIIDACEDYGKPKTNNSVIARFARDYDKVNKLAKVYSVKDLQEILKDNNLNNKVRELNINPKANWYDESVQLLALLFIIAGWSVSGLIDRKNLEDCESIFDLQELLSNGEFVWNEKYKNQDNFWNMCTTAQQKDVFIAFREV